MIIIGAVISQLPLAWVGPKAPIGGKIPVYSGTVWNGLISGTDAGNLKLSTSLGRLISGANPVHITGGPAGLSLKAEAGTKGLRALKAEGTMRALALRDPRLALVNGNFRIDVPDMQVAKTCDYAEGTVWTDFLAQNGSRLRWAGPVLEGPVSCEEGQIVLNLTGKDAAADITAQIRIDLSGTYKTDIMAKVSDLNAGMALQFFGFTAVAGGYRLTEQGKW